LSLSSQIYGFGISNLGSEIREKPIPDLGSQILVHGSKRHRIPDQIRIHNTDEINIDETDSKQPKNL
jgi:hypothetical protein